ncbi:MAG TPA: response regulator [Polyangiaceae bacterium]|nr:response regulator [Polyangiaceae bacterium]
MDQSQSSAHSRPLRALIVEDSEQDAALLLRHLKKSGLQITHLRVDTPRAMQEALSKQTWDIVLSDYELPQFNGEMALALMKANGLDLPFILISGAVAEEVAARAMRSGAHDYFLKSELGPRLVAAIEREIKEVAVRAENMAMQEQLLVSDCLSSMGTLAAGVAHEINNPMTSVMANIDLATASLTHLAQDPALHGPMGEIGEELRDAREAAERIRNIVRDIKIFSRPLSEATGPVSVDKVMESTLRMAWNEVRYRARLVKNYGETPLVEASESRLGQLFLNLVVSATQGLAEGRWTENRIIVSTSTDDQGRAVIEIQGTGPGSFGSHAERNTIPGARHKSPGIAFAICQRIVANLGGLIESDRVKGHHTTFRVTLPPARALPTERSTMPPLSRSTRPRGRVLLIDDEPRNVSAVVRALSREHHIETSHDAVVAMAKIKNGERFDVILCAMVMGEQSGMDVYRALVKIDKEQARNLIFLTSDALPPQLREFLADVPNQRIDKNFDTIHLRLLINDRMH